VNVPLFLQLLIGGLAMGAIYGLIGLGMNLIYNATGGLNFAQGSLVMLGAYVGVTFSRTLGLPVLPAAICALAVMATVGAVFGFLVYEPVRNVNPQRFMLAALASGIFVSEGIQIIWGKLPFMVPRFIAQPSIRYQGLVFDTQNLLILGVVLVAVGALSILLMKTQLGLMMRAVGQSKEVSSLMGIPVRRMIRVTFACSTALATIAGVMAGPIFFVSPLLANLSTKGFAAAVIGGFSPRVSGVILGGIIVGLVEIFAAYLISSAYRDAWGFAFLICFLLIRPRGLFGEQVAQKA